jgi:SAM-dependent methyltransferase
MRLEARDRWIRAAQGWEANADWFARDTMPVSMWMIDAIGPQPGHQILELAAGMGDTGFLAAELIQPGGTLITSDFAPEMLAAAQRRAQRKGLTGIRFRQMDLNVPLDQPAASLDGVLARWVFMLLEDGEAALKEARRVLKPGGRLALAAWAGPDDNLWSATTIRILERRGLLEPDPPGPGQFAWQDPNELREHMEAAGFIDPEIEAVDFALHYPSVAAWWRSQTQMSTRTGDAERAMDEATRAEVLAELEQAAQRFTQADGSLRIPARTWVAAATA